MSNKLTALKENQIQNESKIERLEEEFIGINKTFDSPFHQFKHCTVGLNPQIANQMFEQIGSLKYPVVQFSNKNTFKFFNHKYKPITKCYFFGDSNNQNLILENIQATNDIEELPAYYSSLRSIFIKGLMSQISRPLRYYSSVETVEVNKHVHIPLQAKHRLENYTDDLVVLIEVQSGLYLGEDDIKRYEDIYGRD